MRNASLAALAALALAACGESEPPKTAAAPQPLPPPKPMVQAPARAPAPAPAAAPQLSADELLAERVRTALRDTRKVDGQGVDVRVDGGAVTLFGTASSADERRKIEKFVAGLEGVQSVVSQLVVVRGS